MGTDIVSTLSDNAYRSVSVVNAVVYLEVWIRGLPIPVNSIQSKVALMFYKQLVKSRGLQILSAF